MRTRFSFACAALAAAAVSCGSAGGPAPSGAERGVQKFAVTLQGRDVGYMTLQVEELPSGSLLVAQSTEWTMRLMGAQSTVSMEAEAVTDSSLDLGRMEFHMSDGSAEIRATTVRGDGNGSVVNVDADRVGLVDLRIEGVGDVGSRRSQLNASELNVSWSENVELAYGRGDAAVRLFGANESLVAGVHVEIDRKSVV